MANPEEKQGYSPEAWADRVRNLVKSEMVRQGLSYEDLAQRLQEQGIADHTAARLRSMIARGSFSAAFMIQVFCVLECDVVDISLFAKAQMSEDDLG